MCHNISIQLNEKCHNNLVCISYALSGSTFLFYPYRQIKRKLRLSASFLGGIFRICLEVACDFHFTTTVFVHCIFILFFAVAHKSHNFHCLTGFPFWKAQHTLIIFFHGANFMHISIAMVQSFHLRCILVWH